jgi:prefoldin subunit 5
MSLGWRKINSVLIICLAALGIILCLFLLFEAWNYRQPVTQKLQTGVDQASSVLQISDQGLEVIDQVVQNVYTSTIYLDEATMAFSTTVGSASQFMDTAGTFVGDNLLTTITDTQTALSSAQASAKVIDNILTTLSRVPLIGITYNPAVPLNQALGQVSSSLDPLQSTLQNFQADLNSTRNNMQDFSSQIATLDKNILSIQANLNQAQSTINKYRSQIATVNSWLASVKTSLPRWMTTFAWVITLVIALLIIVQTTLMLQAITQLSTLRIYQENPGIPQ